MPDTTLPSWNDGSRGALVALDKAGDYGITVVSMKRDWKTVFSPITVAPAELRIHE